MTLEPFQQLNHNAFLHSTKAFGGKPQRVRDIMTDFRGHISELLAKVTQKSALEAPVTKEDQEILLEALRSWGALDKDYGYKASLHMSEFRGFAKDPGGGLGAAPKPSEPLAFSDILSSGPVGQPGKFRALRVPDDHVPAGRRHRHDRQGILPGRSAT